MRNLSIGNIFCIGRLTIPGMVVGLLVASAAWAAPLCSGGKVIWHQGKPVGCVFGASLSDGEKAMCRGTVILSPSALGSCTVCIKAALVPMVKSSSQWSKLEVGVSEANAQPANFSCQSGAFTSGESPRPINANTVPSKASTRCRSCTCPRGWFDPNRNSCVIGMCDVPGMPNGDKGGGYFAWGGKLFRDIPGLDCRPGVWTPWLDRDDPSATGDYETFKDFLAAGQVCRNVSGIECRRKKDQVPWQNTGEVYQCDWGTGGVCVNAKQPAGGMCSDYEVRFCCPRAQP